jgi:HK97 gp10 family phage protein
VSKSFRIKGELDIKPLLAELDNVDRKVRRHALKTGVTKASRIVAKAAKQTAPVGETGQLKRSIGQKVKVYSGRGVIVGIIGPRKGFRIVVDGKPVDPIHYARLVEFGHGGPAPAPARPFLRTAWTQSRQAIMAVMAAEVQKALAKGK